MKMIHVGQNLFREWLWNLHTCWSHSQGSQGAGPETFYKSSSTLLQDFPTQTVRATNGLYMRGADKGGFSFSLCWKMGWVMTPSTSAVRISCTYSFTHVVGPPGFQAWANSESTNWQFPDVENFASGHIGTYMKCVHFKSADEKWKSILIRY